MTTVKMQTLTSQCQRSHTERAKSICTAVIRTTRRDQWVVLSLLTLGLTLSGNAAQAGLLQPLLQMMRPKLENKLAEYCQRVAKEALREADPRLEQFHTVTEQPCQGLAKPVSECLIRETSRSGRELGVLSELLSGQIGDDGDVVIKRCLASMLGLNEKGLQDISIDELFRRLRS